MDLADRDQTAGLLPRRIAFGEHLDVSVAQLLGPERRLVAERAFEAAAIEDEQLALVLRQQADLLVEEGVRNADGARDVPLVVQARRPRIDDGHVVARRDDRVFAERLQVDQVLVPSLPGSNRRVGRPTCEPATAKTIARIAEGGRRMPISWKSSCIGVGRAAGGQASPVVRLSSSVSRLPHRPVCRRFCRTRPLMAAEAAVCWGVAPGVDLRQAWCRPRSRH